MYVIKRPGVNDDTVEFLLLKFKVKLVIVMPSKQFLRFMTIGLIVLLLENLTTLLLMLILNDFLIARTLSTLLAIAQSYLLNLKYSFSSSHSISKFISYLSGVALSIGVSYFVSLCIYYVVFSSSYPLVATNIGALAAALANFFFQRSVTFKRSD